MCKNEFCSALNVLDNEMLVENIRHILLHMGRWAILCMSSDEHTHIFLEVQEKRRVKKEGDYSTCPSIPDFSID